MGLLHDSSDHRQFQQTAFNTVLGPTGIPVPGNPSISCFFYRWSYIEGDQSILK